MLIPITLPLLSQIFVSGLLAGGVYALIALGLTMIFGVMRVINVSHGEMVMLGAYVTFWLFHLVGFNPLLSLVLSMPALFLVGLFMERFFVARVLDLPEITSLLLTFGFSILMVNMALYFWTADFRSVEYLTGSVKFAGLYFSLPRLVAFWVALAITLGTFLFLKRSRIGKAIRATSQSRDVAMACGINVRRIYAITFGIGAALAGAGGSLTSIMITVYPEMGALLTLKSFTVIVLGGMGNFAGAFWGGLTLGLAEAFGSLFISEKVSEAIAYCLLVLILVIKPSGLFGIVRR